MTNSPVQLAVLDIETSGLKSNQHMILEAGIALYTRAFELVAQESVIICDDAALSHVEWLEEMSNWSKTQSGEPWSGADFVYKMHTKNKLISSIMSYRSEGHRTSLADAEKTLISFLEKHNIGKGYQKLPMTGSSIHFDRDFFNAQMPNLSALFSHRNIDISTVRLLVDLYAPELNNKKRMTLQPASRHRSLEDCRDSIKELEFYVDNIFAGWRNGA